MLIASSSVVIHDLDIPGRALTPFETNPPLVVDSDAVLPEPIAVQGFETIARRRAQIFELFRRIDGEKLCSRPALNLVGQSLDNMAGKERSRALAGKASVGWAKARSSRAVPTRTP
jgi:hypothetical protein